MGRLKGIAGLVFGASFLMIGMLLEGGNLRTIMHLTSFLMVFGPITGFAIAAYPSSLLMMGVRTVLTGYSPKHEDRPRIRAAFHNLGQVAVLAATVSAIIGMVHVASNLNHIETIGQGVAVVFLSFLYGLGFKLFVVLPVEAMTTGEPKNPEVEHQHEMRRGSKSINRAA